jgi:hypothetical protein
MRSGSFLVCATLVVSMAEARQNVVIDAAPGIDDAMAILPAFARSDAEGPLRLFASTVTT